MKKIIGLSTFLLVFILAFYTKAPVTHAETLDVTEEILENVTEEEALDVTEEEISENVTEEEALDVTEEDQENAPTIETRSIIRNAKWGVASKSKVADTYGSWKTCVDDISLTGTVACSHATSVTNSFTGTLKIPIKDLDLSLGFSTSKTTQVTLTKTAPADKGKRVKILYRPVFTTYLVKQEMTVGSKVLQTENLTAKQYSHMQFDVVAYWLTNKVDFVYNLRLA